MGVSFKTIKKKRATCVTLPVIRVHLLVLSIDDRGEVCHPLSQSFFRIGIKNHKKKRATCVTLPVIRVHLLVLSIGDQGEGCHPLFQSFFWQ